MKAATPALVSHKAAFARFLAASPGRLHVAAHSHHAWPDVTFAAQEEAWRDAVALADLKWEKIFGEVLPRAQRHVARRLALPEPGTIVFAPSTHELVTRVISCFEQATPIRILTTDSEFHSFERQTRRLEEAGRARVERVLLEPYETFPQRFRDAIGRGGHHLIYVSQVFFDSGLVLEDLAAIAEAVPRRETYLVVDGYHSFMALPVDFSALAGRAFFVGGGYKYAMAGEGACFMHCPDGYGERPVLSGWFAGFADLEAGVRRVSYPRDGGRFLGATFDPTAIYRFNAVQDWLESEGVSVADIHERSRRLQSRFLEAIDGRALPVEAAQLIPPRPLRRGNFLTFRMPDAAGLHRRLLDADVVADVRGDRLRIGFGLYHDEDDVDGLVERLARVGR